MSEIQRYTARELNDTGRWLFGTHSQGEFCRYTDLLWCQRHYRLALLIISVLAPVCGVLAGLLVQGRTAQGLATVPTDATEHTRLLHEMQEMKKSRDDYKSLALNYKAQIKALTSKVDGHVSQLEALQARGLELDRLNREQAQRMNANQGVVLEAKRILGPLEVQHVTIVER